MNALQDGYLGFSIFCFFSLKNFEKYFFLKKMSIKSTLFRIFKKPDDMLCKLISTIHIPKMKTIHLFLIPKWSKKPTKIIGQNFEMSFLGVINYLRTWKYHHSIQHEKLHRIDTFLSSKKQTQNLTSLDLTWPDLDPKLAGSRASGLHDAHRWSISRKWFIKDASRASFSSFFA